MDKILRVENLKKNNILNGISFSVDKGEMVAIMGPSGSGKSTLLYNVSGMDKADSGSVILGDKEILSLKESEKSELRLNSMGFVFQNMNMLSNLTVIENIMYPAIHDKKGTSKKTIENKAIALMQKLGIEDLKDRKINQVSGGQLQRACICRSYINNPKIIFADEPTGALNQSSTTEVMNSFRQINEDGATVLIVTHDSKVASMCNRVLFLVDGEIRAEWKNGDSDINEWLDDLEW